MSEVNIDEYRLTDEERECVTKDGVRKPKEILHSAIKKLGRIQSLLEDKEYVAAADALIPRAEVAANRAVQKNPSANWSLAYHREINRLKRQAGLIR